MRRVAARRVLGRRFTVDNRSVLAVAGDISCASCAQARTSALVTNRHERVLVLGDSQYPTGALEDFRSHYAPTWGRFLARTFPTPGNHEYEDLGASGYFRYFGVRAGPDRRGYYAFDAGPWRMLSLNSNCGAERCDAGSRQVTWIEAELRAARDRCVAAFFHHPRFSSGWHGNDAAIDTIWATLERGGADLVLTGHDHDYERLGPLDEHGVPHETGMRSFIVGTGGAELRDVFPAIAPGSMRRTGTEHGILELELTDGAMQWRFLGVTAAFTDMGSARCR